VKPFVISLYGYKGSGKSTAAEYLMAQGVERVKFADGLKKMLYALGLTEEEIEGPLKEKPCELLGGKTPRYAMQTLGTEWGRERISQDLWVNAWKKEVSIWQDDMDIDVLVDDMRFHNEVLAVKAVGGVLVKLVRGERPKDTHISESFIDTFVPDYTIVNNGSLEDLYDALEDLMRKVTREVWEPTEEPF